MLLTRIIVWCQAAAADVWHCQAGTEGVRASAHLRLLRDAERQGHAVRYGTWSVFSAVTGVCVSAVTGGGGGECHQSARWCRLMTHDLAAWPTPGPMQWQCPGELGSRKYVVLTCNQHFW